MPRYRVTTVLEFVAPDDGEASKLVSDSLSLVHLFGKRYDLRIPDTTLRREGSERVLRRLKEQ